MGDPTDCVYCGTELWSARERDGVCCSCQGLPLDEGGDLAESRGEYFNLLDELSEAEFERLATLSDE